MLNARRLQGLAVLGVSALALCGVAVAAATEGVSVETGGMRLTLSLTAEAGLAFDFSPANQLDRVRELAVPLSDPLPPAL